MAQNSHSFVRVTQEEESPGWKDGDKLSINGTMYRTMLQLSTNPHIIGWMLLFPYENPK